MTMTLAATLDTDTTRDINNLLSSSFYLAPDISRPFAMLAAAAAGARALGSIGAGGLPFIGAGGAQPGIELLVFGDKVPKSIDPSRVLGVASEFFQLPIEPIAPGSLSAVIPVMTQLSGTSTLASRALTDGTAIDSGNQALAFTNITVTLAEYGGPYTGSAVTPLSITQLARRAAKHDLIVGLASQLKRDRARFLETVIQDLLLSTTNVTIASGGTGGATQATMVLNQNLVTDYDLDILFEALANRGVEPFADGYYFLFVPTNFKRMLKQDATVREYWGRNFVNAPDALMSGYLGDMGNFHIVVDPSMQTTTGGASSAVTVYQAIATGPRAIAWATDLPPEPRTDKNDDFARQLRAIWLCIEGWKLMDVNRCQKLLMS